MTDHDVSSSARFDRRLFLSRAGLVAGGALGVSLLDACTPGSPSSPAAAPPGGTASSGGTPATAGNAAVKLPTYVPFEGPKPDLPGNEKGLDPAFFKFPTDLVQTVATPPGDGSTVSAITYLTLA